MRSVKHINQRQVQLSSSTLKDRGLVSLGLMLLCVLLVFLYSKSIALDYEYLGYRFDFKIPQFAFSIFLLALLLYGQIRARNYLAYYVSVLLTLFIFIPNAILTTFDHGYYEISLFCFLLSGAVLFIRDDKLHTRTKKVFADNTSLVFPLFIGTACMIALYMVFFGLNVNWSLILLDDDVYEGRVEFGNQVASSIIFPYTYSLLTKFVIPIGIILSFRSKRWLLVSLFSVFQVYLFLINPHKTVMFIFLVVIALSLIDYKKHLKYIVWGATILLVLTIEFDLNFVENMLVRRVLFVPAKLNQAYYEVFDNVKLYLSYSIFSPFVDYPLNESPAYYVSSNFYNNVSSHSNNGILSSGYMNFGFLGVLGNILFFFFVIKYLKNSLFNKELIIIFLPTIFLLNSSYLLTALVTHGLWFVLFFAFINKKNENISH